MSNEQKSSHTMMIAVIGALATVLVGVVPIVVSLLHNDNPSPTALTAESTSETGDTSSDEVAGSPPTTAAPSDPTFVGSDDVLDRLADGCYSGDLDACDQLYNVSAVGSDYEWYGGTCGGILDQVSDQTCRSILDQVQYYDDLAAACAAADLTACDQLYLESPVGSDWEYYGATCGERLYEPANGRCWEFA